LIQDQAIRYFLVYFLNQTLIDLIPFQAIFFNIKKHKPILICHSAFSKPFSKLI